jgi:ligand-binding SRPBCC domain-containing protein
MLHRLQASQFIKSDLTTVWKFISAPGNLAKITPAYMGISILDKHAVEAMYAGQIIEYRITPIAGIKMSWVSEITHVREKEYFVDEQRYGPYAFWHHQHFLKEVPGGVEMIDILHYKIPFGFLGRIVNQLFVKPRLNGIFEFRRNTIDRLFNQA